MDSRSKKSETNTENLFRNHYGSLTFIEKSGIPAWYGFKSKKGTQYKGFPDFFLELDDYVIVVEAKADDQEAAQSEVQWYMSKNTIQKNILGIAVSGQTIDTLKVNYYVKKESESHINAFGCVDYLYTLEELEEEFENYIYGSPISDYELTTILKGLNKQFHNSDIRDTDRSLFFSGIMIALCSDNFRSIYKKTQAPSSSAKARTKARLLEAHYMNKAIIAAVEEQLEDKINNLSKEYSWKDRFSFIKTIDIPLNEYIDIVKKIEYKIYKPFTHNQKQDLLGRAYKIFLNRAGKVDSKNIILTPDHIKTLMVELADLNPNDVVIDTCTGSGGFLMEAMEKLIAMSNGSPAAINEIHTKRLIGFEIDSVLFALTCSNMFLHGDGRTNMLFRSSLLTDSQEDVEVLNYIKKLAPKKAIINPPYENNKPILFTLQAIDYIEPNGKLIVIMPTPTLTRNQGGLTEKLLKNARLDAVIKMPEKLFSEQKRTVNTSIFCFTKTKHKKKNITLFYDLEDDGYVSIQHKGRVDKYGKWQSIENDVLECITTSTEKEGVCEKRYIYNENHKLNCNGFKEKDIAENAVQIRDLFVYEKGQLASESNENGEYPFITASDEIKTHNSYTNDEEALVFAVAASGSLGKTHYYNGKFIASNLCIILTPKNNSDYEINMLFYKYYFDTIRKQIRKDLADGTSKLTIDPEDLMDYYIEYFDIEVQNKFVEENILPLQEAKTLFQEMQKTVEDNILKL